MLINGHLYVLNNVYYDYNLKLDYKTIVKSTLNGDTPFIKVRYHWYNPRLNKGLFIFTNAKKYAEKWFNRAIIAYKDKDYKKSSNCLGIVLHIICDLSIPGHTHLFYHYFHSDIHEIYINKNLAMLFKKLKINKEDIKIKKETNELHKIIDQLAMKSYCMEDCYNSFIEGFLYRYFDLRRYSIPEKSVIKQSNQIIYNAVYYSHLVFKLFERKVS